VESKKENPLKVWGDQFREKAFVESLGGGGIPIDRNGVKILSAIPNTAWQVQGKEETRNEERTLVTM